MDETLLLRRLRLGEDSRTEFKRAEDDALPGISKTLVAFANSGGGELFVGVDDDGTPAGLGGVKEADAWMRKVTAACQTSIEPALSCRVNKVEVGGALVLVVEVPAWAPRRPYRTKGTFYTRDGTESREASHDEVVRMLQSQAVHFDEEPVRGAAGEDLDEAAADRFFRDHYPAFAPDRRAMYLRATKCLDESDRPTVAGILFFGREPQRFFPEAKVTAIRFRGTSFADDKLDRKTFEGGILSQAEAAAKFLDQYVPAPETIQGWKRTETGIPQIVAREALYNAIAHRDYVVASQTRVFVFDDRVEITNPGTLLNRMTLDSIRIGGISQHRNPAIAALLLRSGLVELASTGVPRMIEAMRKAGLPEPDFSLEGGRFRAVLRARPAAVA